MSTADPSTESISNSSGTAFGCCFAIIKYCRLFCFELPVQRSWSWKYPFPHEVTHCPFCISRDVWHEEHSNPLVQAEHVSLQASKRKNREERCINPECLGCSKTPLLWQKEIISPHFGKRVWEFAFFRGLHLKLPEVLNPWLLLSMCLNAFPDKAWQSLYNKLVGSYKQKHSEPQRRQSSDRV